MTVLVAQTMYGVLDAGQDLRSALADGVDTQLAVDRLATTIEMSMITFGAAVQGFEPGDSAVPPAPDTADDLLATAVGQFWVANVAISAGAAVGENAGTATARSDRAGAFDASLASMGTTAAAVDVPADDRFGFAAESDVPPPADLPAAVALLGGRITTTLSAVADSTAGVFTRAVPALLNHGPEDVRKAWGQVGERLDLGHIGGRLLRLGLRALEAALGALHRLVPKPALLAARDHVHRVKEELAANGLATAVARWALEIDLTAAVTQEDLARDGLQTGRLTLAIASLDELSARYRRLMNLAGTASDSIKAFGVTAALLQLAIPNLAVIIPAALLLVLGVVVVLGRDFVDADAAPGWVRGVRHIVREAVESA